MTLLLVEPFTGESYVLGPNNLSVTDFEDVNRIGGTIMAGQKKAWHIWSDLYYETMELMLKYNKFIGKDQTVMNNVVVKYPHYFNLVSPQPYFGGKGDSWFYLQYYFSSHNNG